ncbi:hypothetical protein P7C70_g7066, partial [Phenoliferia sp. Uapishka_3]
MITLESLLAERRPTPFVQRLPYEVAQRRERRGGLHLLDRAGSTVNGGMEYRVRGQTGSFIFLDILNLSPTNPLSYQTSFLSSELFTLFPSLSSKKRPAHSPPPRPNKKSTKRAKPLPPVSTTGLDDESVRQVLLYALQIHPKSVTHVDRRRKTPLDGLSAEQNRQVLEILGGEYEDVKDVIGKRIEVSAGISDAIDSILERVNIQSGKETKLAAIEALISIGIYMLTQMDGEIGQIIRNDEVSPREVGNAIAQIIDMLQDRGDISSLEEELEEINSLLQECGIRVVAVALEDMGADEVDDEVEESGEESGSEDEDSWFAARRRYR